jgi:DNA replication protein DnaC
MGWAWPAAATDTERQVRERMSELKRLTIEEVQKMIPKTESKVQARRAREAKFRAFRQEIPPLFRDATLKGFDNRGRTALHEVVERAERYIELFPGVGLLKLFQGVPGSGKTHICYAIGSELARKGYGVKVVKLAHLIMDLRSSWRGGGESEEYLLGRYREPALLIVDEISSHSYHGDGRAHLYQVVDHRIEFCRPTIMTTNDEPGTVMDVLGPALYDRCSLGGMWDFGTESYRPKLGDVNKPEPAKKSRG